MRTELRAIAACAALLLASTAGAQESLDRVMDTVRQGASQPDGMSIVREAALRDGALTIGARQGLLDKTCAIRREIEAQRVALDKRFRFADLMMGRGVLPPVISEARDSVALDATVMRVASRVYHLDEPARVVDIPPTWRDWLLVGLPADGCGEVVQEAASLGSQLRPKNAAEESYFRAAMSSSYEAGVKQAKDIFEDNLARLERSYHGMRRYFELFQRGMVSAPIIVTSTDVVRRDDPNTLVVGNTVIRITVPVDFVEKVDEWKPLAN